MLDVERGVALTEEGVEVGGVWGLAEGLGFQRDFAIM